jgi:hypothetical protein
VAKDATVDESRLESSGEVMAHVKLRDEADIDPKLFASWLEQARAIELSH